MTKSIQALIDKTPAYGTVNLDDTAAVVEQTITIDKPLTIRGGMVRESGLLEPIFDGLVGGIDFDGLRIEGAETLETWEPATDIAHRRAAIRLRGPDSRVQRCRISGKSAAVRVEANHVTLSHNYAYGLFQKDKPAPGANWHQLFSVSGDFHTIEVNHLFHCGGGITCGDTLLHSSLIGNLITGSFDNGIYLSSAAHCNLSANHIFDAFGGSGIKVRGSFNTLNANNLSGIPVVGIVLTGRNLGPAVNLGEQVIPITGYGNICRGNTLYDVARYGVMVDDHDDGFLYGTQVCGNSLARIATASTAQSRWSGLFLQGPGIVANENVIAEIGYESNAAMHFWKAPDSQAQRNQLVNSRVGILGRESPRLRLDRNYFQHVEQLMDIR